MIRLSNATLKLDILPRFGGRWMRLRALVDGAWKDLLWPPPRFRHLEKAPLFGGAFLMAPWCNRIPGGKFTFKREGFPLTPNFPDGSAIHGDVYHRPWEVATQNASSVSFALDTRSEPDFNFPFDFWFGHRIRLVGTRIEASLAAMNVGKDPAPVGLGFHPFFLRRLNPKSREALITIPAPRYFPSSHAVPTGPAKPVSGATDVRTPTPLNARVIDAGYIGLAGRPVSLHYPDDGVSVHLTPGAEAKHLYVWAPSEFEGKAAPFVCVEPMSMSVNGFVRREQKHWDSGVQVLGAREKLSVSWTIDVSER